MKHTKAAEYRAMLKAKRGKRQTEFVELPSGFVFELSRPPLEAYMVTGRYPQSLVRDGLKALKEKGISPLAPDAAAEAIKGLDMEGISESLIFMRELVREACVNPKLVVGATGDDEIEPDELDIEDFNFICHWCLDYKGEKNADGIRSFRTGQERGTASSEPDGATVQQTAVEPVAD